MNQLHTLDMKLRITLDLKTANGLDYISPGTSSSSSSIVTPLNASSNVNAIVEGRGSQEITATEVTATVSTSSTTTSAAISVSASLTRKCIFCLLTCIFIDF